MKKNLLIAAISSLLLCSCQPGGLYFDRCKPDDYVHLYAVESTLGTLTGLTFYGTVSGKDACPGSGFGEEGWIWDYRIGTDITDTVINPGSTCSGNLLWRKMKVTGAYIIPDCNNPQDTLFIPIDSKKSPFYTTNYHEYPSKDLGNDYVYRHFAEIVPEDHIVKYVFTIDDEYISYLRTLQK